MTKATRRALTESIGTFIRPSGRAAATNTPLTVDTRRSCSGKDGLVSLGSGAEPARRLGIYGESWDTDSASP